MFVRFEVTKATFIKSLETNDLFLECPNLGYDVSLRQIDGTEDDNTTGRIGDWSICEYNPKDGMILEVATFTSKEKALDWMYLEAQKELAAEKDDDDLIEWWEHLQSQLED